jgi:uncharacterized protein (DUF1786 family)
LEGLLKHWDQRLAAMTPAERAEIAQGVRDMLSGCAVAFGRLGGGGVRYALGVFSWVGRQIAMERSAAEMLKAINEKAEKAGPHVAAIFRAI